MSLPAIAVSIGDPNGIGLEIALKSHREISAVCRPLYCADRPLVDAAAHLLGMAVPDDFETVPLQREWHIEPGIVTASAGHYSYRSFLKAVELTEAGKSEAVVTLPIHKEAWSLAGIGYKGHTDMLRDYFKQDAIMMLGCRELYVALFTEHIPLKDVASRIHTDKLTRFLVDFYRSTGFDDIAVLGLNPHAGDNGVLGKEENAISAAIEAANSIVGNEIKCNGAPFFGPVVPDTAFTPLFRNAHRHIVAMYHDQGLAPLKALYFDESVNISLNLPIVRTSVDHGTAFDIAYKGEAKTLSYLEAVKTAVAFISS